MKWIRIDSYWELNFLSCYIQGIEALNPASNEAYNSLENYGSCEWIICVIGSNSPSFWRSFTHSPCTLAPLLKNRLIYLSSLKVTIIIGLGTFINHFLLLLSQNEKYYCGRGNL